MNRNDAEKILRSCPTIEVDWFRLFTFRKKFS